MLIFQVVGSGSYVRENESCMHISYMDREIFDIFRKVELNIPLFDCSKKKKKIPLFEVIKLLLRYAKFLKEIFTRKRRLEGNERVNINCNVFAIIQHLTI